MEQYCLILADFYQYYSKNRSIACSQACYFLSKLGITRRLIDFIKNKECQIYLRSHERSKYLNVSQFLIFLNTVEFVIKKLFSRN